MKIRFGRDGSVKLRGIQVFNEFSVDAESLSLEQVDSFLRAAEVGRLSEGRAEIGIDFILAEAGARSRNPEWRERFDGMIAYARTKDWISGDGRSVIAHVENATTTHVASQ